MPTIARPRLPARQRQLLTLLAEGHNLGQAAAIMHVTRATARNHAHELRLRLQADTTAHAVAIAISLGIITPRV